MCARVEEIILRNKNMTEIQKNKKKCKKLSNIKTTKINKK